MKNNVAKHMRQNADSFEGFAVGFSNLFRRNVKHHLAAKPCPIDAAARSFDVKAFEARE